MGFRSSRRAMLVTIVAGVLVPAGYGCAPGPAVLRGDESLPVVLPAVVDRRPAASPRRIEVGRSTEGRPIVLEIYGVGPRPTLFLAGVHGDETAGVSMVRLLADLLEAEPERLRGTSVGILATANPDGLARRTRKNARGVDVNRNFPASNWRPSRPGAWDHGGPHPGSEPETAAIVRAIEILQPAHIISIHSRSRGGPCNNFDGPAEDVARIMAASNGYPVVADMGYPTPGSLGSWAGRERRLPVVTLEVPAGRSVAACWAENRQALLDVVSAVADDFCGRTGN